MTLLRYIVKGFGWTVGRQLAQEAVDDLRQIDDGEDGGSSDCAASGQEARPPSWRQRWAKARAARAARRAAERQVRDRQRAEAQAEREIEQELVALKRKIERDG